MKTERKNPLNRQNAKNHHKQLNQSTPQIAFFSDSALVVLISVITLLLQLISFATTWNGSKIYLEGVFSHASLLFAIAIQATAYFFSNSLRGKLRPLKVIALCAAVWNSPFTDLSGKQSFTALPFFSHGAALKSVVLSALPLFWYCYPSVSASPFSG